MAPAIVEPDAGARHEVPDGSRHQDLLRPSRRSDSGAGMHGDAADLGSRDLAFPGVEPRPHLQADLTDCVADGAGTPEAVALPRRRAGLGAEAEALVRATTRVYGRTKQLRPLTESPARRRDPLESTPMTTLGWKGPVIE